MKHMIEYLNLDENEYKMAKQLDNLPPEALALFIKLIMGKRSDFEKTEQEIREYAERYRKEREK